MAKLILCFLGILLATSAHSARVCPPNDRSTECNAQRINAWAAGLREQQERAEAERMFQASERERRRRDDQRRECLKRLKPNESSSLCSR